ncbi:hypothetical protein ATG_06680 [Desulfurococcaceae archaeon AG1]|jgi:hypothetical protein|nr:MAG: hypothetical protein DJ555_06375 [Desulfurococcaceae archaeon]GAY25465.1 hypothetical protein ATG_06680 [Desulfurococcaceae archaeon AG1]
MREIDMALCVLIGIELYVLQILIGPGLYSPILSMVSLALLVIPVVRLEGTARGVASVLEILLGLEIIALGFLIPGASIYSIPLGIGIITIMGILLIALSREGIPRWISLATIPMIYVLMIVIAEEPVERAIIVGMLGAFLAGGFVGLTLTREPEEIEV